MRSHGMNAELILLNFYRRPFTDTNAWTPARERLWLRYVVSRYAAFGHVFLWTIANEYETHPDGRYRLDFPDDVDWAKATTQFIKANDPYHHLVTVHPVVSASRRGETPRAPIDPPWRIGEFFGHDAAMDVLSQQTGASDEGAQWDETLRCWVGDSSSLVASLRTDRQYRKPVLNTENGYEFLRGHPTAKKQVHHTDKVRRSAWRSVCAGGYFAAGFHGTIGHSDVWNRLDSSSWLEGQEFYLAHKPAVVLGDDQVPCVIQSDRANLAHTRLADIIEPCPVAEVRAIATAIQKKMHEPIRVDVPHLAAAMGADEEAAVGQGPHGTDFFQRRGRGQLPIAAAE